ncbi:MAG TPA: ABC transporter ATP-binding protein [Rhabdochlamydiaceae bacterium]|jgi:putative ABC transport system ATP-binding protein
MSIKPLAVYCKEIHKSFGEGSAKVHALRGVNLSVVEGEFLIMMGPSGSGKTTLLSVISGILTQDGGECLVLSSDINNMPNGEKTQFRGRHIGFVFQSFNLIPTLTSLENISIPLILNGEEKNSAQRKAEELLRLVGIPEKKQVYPPQLSGGQQQRVAIARAMIHDPDLVVCDEPTSFLDHDTGNKIMELLHSMISEKGKTLIVVTHDVRVLPFADRIVHLEDGTIVKSL